MRAFLQWYLTPERNQAIADAVHASVRRWAWFFLVIIPALLHMAIAFHHDAQREQARALAQQTGQYTNAKR